MVLLSVTIVVTAVVTAVYCNVHLGYWHMYITIVQLASPAIHNKDNSHMGMKMNAETLYRYIFILLPFPSSPFLNP